MKLRSLTLFLITGLMIMALSAPSYAGDVVKLYQHYCSQCHGLKGDGKGPNAASLTVTPRNHTDPKEMGKLSDKDISTAIVEGGGAVGKSTSMPVWGKTISTDEVNDIVKYLRQLCNCKGPS